MAKLTIAVVGLGYVGLPLAVALAESEVYDVVGFDINSTRIAQLRTYHDVTGEVSVTALKTVLEAYPDEPAAPLRFTDEPSHLASAHVYIITVPTPVGEANRPDFEPLISASATVGKYIQIGALVIYESTVYPGATEEICVPVLEEVSGMTFNKDFFVGYSPERINPGDKKHTVKNIVKVTSGSTPGAADAVDAIYRKGLGVRTHKAPSIAVAEASKVIENTQRDLNIAFMNELSLLFDAMGIDTHDVLAAAQTKWNFLPFNPGLVGGHCIGVDPYYLMHKAEQAGVPANLIARARSVNNQMVGHVVRKVTQLLNAVSLPVRGSSVLVLGATFKEDCPDLRNSKALDVIAGLNRLGANVSVVDCVADLPQLEAAVPAGVRVVPNWLPLMDAQFDLVLLAVPHADFRKFDKQTLDELTVPHFQRLFIDLKGVINKAHLDGYMYYRL